jgi:hypothetical protein
LGLVVLTLVLYGRGWTQNRGAFGDSFHHLINGIFVYDAACDPVASLSNPLEFAYRYYRHFPAVNLGYYLPLFAMLEALLMSVFGVSSACGQLAVLLMAVVMALFMYAWLRLRFDAWWAAATAAAMISAPLLVGWGRDIMLEIPVLALMIGAMWAFERVLRADRPRGQTIALGVLLAVMALATKQHSLMLLGVFGISLLTTRRWRLLADWRFLIGIAVIAAAAAAVVLMTLRMGGDAVGHSVGFTAEHVADRFNLEQWTVYPQRLPNIVGWPTVILAAVGLVVCLRGRTDFVSPALAWMVVFYLMHSYFKAQSIRYACLWIPPFFVLAAIGLKQLRWCIPLPSKRLPRRAVPVGTLLLVVWVGLSVARATRVGVPHVSSAYQQAAHDLSEEMGSFTCLTFFPDRPGRMAVCFRLAVEERRGPQRDIYAFGRIVRAIQLFNPANDVPSDPVDLARSLREWNIKYILTETPRPIDKRAGDDRVAEIVDGILAGNDYRVMRTYAVQSDSERYPRRELVLYVRSRPMSLNPTGAPPILTGRIPIDLPPAEMQSP